MSFILNNGDIVPTANMFGAGAIPFIKSSVTSTSAVTVAIDSSFGGPFCRRFDLVNLGTFKITFTVQGGANMNVPNVGVSASIDLLPGEQIIFSKNDGYDDLIVAQKVAQTGGSSGTNVAILDHGTSVISAVSSIDFEGTGVVVGASGNSATITVAGPTLSSATPLMDGTATAGVATQATRGDHVHPTDTSRAADSLVVHLAGTETITGSKTFSVNPTLTNAPATGTDASNKTYVDTKNISATDGVNSTSQVKTILANQNLSLSVNSGTGALTIVGPAKATNSSLGVVQADGVTLTIDSNGVMSATVKAATYSVVANQAARLALPQSANLTIALQTDVGHVYYLNANLNPAVAGNWVDGGSTAATVISFNSRTGAVLPVVGDYRAYFQSWNITQAYSAGESVIYTDNNPYYANGNIPANTAFVIGTTGATWRLLSAIASATTSSLGVVQLAGDLGGTAVSPSVVKINGTTISGTPTGTNSLLLSNAPSSAIWVPFPQATNLAVGGVQLAGDVGGSATLLSVVRVSGANVPPSSPTAAGQYYRTTNATNTTWSAIQAGDLPLMTGATPTVAGTLGAVPTPAIGQNKFRLQGDATWQFPNALGNTSTLANQTANFNIATTQNTDGMSYVAVTQTTSNIIATLSNPQTTSQPLSFIVANKGTVSFTISNGGINYSLLPSTTVEYVWDVAALTWYPLGNNGVIAEFGSNLTITDGSNIVGSTQADIPGATFTLPTAGVWEVSFNIQYSTANVSQNAIFFCTDSSNNVVAGSIYNMYAQAVTTMTPSTPQSASTLLNYVNNAAITFRVTTTGSTSYKLRGMGGSAGQTIAIVNKTTPGGGTQGSSNIYWAKVGGFTYAGSNFAGATSTVGGLTGAVPAPTAGQQNNLLRGDGTWSAPVIINKGPTAGFTYQFATQSQRSNNWNNLSLTIGGMTFGWNSTTFGANSNLTWINATGSTAPTNVGSTQLGVVQTPGSLSLIGGVANNLTVWPTTTQVMTGQTISTNYQMYEVDIAVRGSNGTAYNGARWKVRATDTGSTDLVVTIEYWGPAY